MITQVLPATTAAITKAADYISQGAVVAFPTETVYGLGADALNPKAVKKIFAAKNRPADNPLIIHIAHTQDLLPLVTHIPHSAQLLIDEFWPGPLSIVLSKSQLVPSITTAGLDTVVVRCVSHPVARALIVAAKTPIAAPSANISGRVSPTTAQHVWQDMNNKIPLILDAGDIKYGIESTVIDCTKSTPIILRPGSITKEMITMIIQTETAATDTPAVSPGMKYQHYAPGTALTLITGNELERKATLRYYSKIINQKDAVWITHDPTSTLPNHLYLPKNKAQAAAKIYSLLLEADSFKCSEIVIEGFLETGVGVALMNRLSKAAQKII